MYHPDVLDTEIVADQTGVDDAIARGLVLDPPVHVWYPHLVPVKPKGKKA